MFNSKLRPQQYSTAMIHSWISLGTATFVFYWSWLHSGSICHCFRLTIDLILLLFQLWQVLLWWFTPSFDNKKADATFYDADAMLMVLLQHRLLLLLKVLQYTFICCWCRPGNLLLLLLLLSVDHYSFYHTVIKYKYYFWEIWLLF